MSASSAAARASSCSSRRRAARPASAPSASATSRRRQHPWARARHSEYRTQLREKQRLKRFYGQIVPDAPIYSAFGDEPAELSAGQLALDVAARGTPAVALPDVDAIVDHLAKSCAPGDVVVTLSNGGFGGIWGKLLARLGG